MTGPSTDLDDPLDGFESLTPVGVLPPLLLLPLPPPGTYEGFVPPPPLPEVLGGLLVDLGGGRPPSLVVGSDVGSDVGGVGSSEVEEGGGLVVTGGGSGSCVVDGGGFTVVGGCGGGSVVTGGGVVAGGGGASVGEPA